MRPSRSQKCNLIAPSRSNGNNSSRAEVAETLREADQPCQTDAVYKVLCRDLASSPQDLPKFAPNAEKLPNLCRKPLRINSFWLRGLDLNQRPLGYEFLNLAIS
jgi:hypothetical protein